MTATTPHRRILAGTVCALALTASVWSVHAAVTAGGVNAASCSRSLATRDSALPANKHRACVRAVIGTYLAAQQNRLPASRVLLADDVIRYPLGPKPAHRPGGAARLRASYPTDISRLGRPEWAIEGDRAFVSYTVFTRRSGRTPALVETDRYTLRHGLLWEIVTDAIAPPSPPTAGGSVTPGPLLVGVPPDSSRQAARTVDDPFFCSEFIADHGDAALTPVQHRHCMDAIASTYFDAEQNTLPGWEALIDPRALRYEFGQRPVHLMGEGDALRASEGRLGANVVIQKIANREILVDGNTVWIRYDGYTWTAIGKPDFYVMERLTIRNGLIWEVRMSSTVQCTVGTPCKNTYL